MTDDTEKAPQTFHQRMKSIWDKMQRRCPYTHFNMFMEAIKKQDSHCKCCGEKQHPTRLHMLKPYMGDAICNRCHIIINTMREVTVLDAIRDYFIDCHPEGGKVRLLRLMAKQNKKEWDEGKAPEYAIEDNELVPVKKEQPIGWAAIAEQNKLNNNLELTEEIFDARTVEPKQGS